MNHSPMPWRSLEMTHDTKPRPPLLPEPTKYELARKRPPATWMIVGFMAALFVAAIVWVWLVGRP